MYHYRVIPPSLPPSLLLSLSSLPPSLALCSNPPRFEFRLSVSAAYSCSRRSSRRRNRPASQLRTRQRRSIRHRSVTHQTRTARRAARRAAKAEREGNTLVCDDNVNQPIVHAHLSYLSFPLAAFSSLRHSLVPSLARSLGASSQPNALFLDSIANMLYVTDTVSQFNSRAYAYEYGTKIR